MNKLVFIYKPNCHECSTKEAVPFESHLSAKEINKKILAYAKKYGKAYADTWHRKLNYAIKWPDNLIIEGLKFPIDSSCFWVDSFYEYRQGNHGYAGVNVTLPMVLTLDEWYACEWKEKTIKCRYNKKLDELPEPVQVIPDWAVGATGCFM